MRTTWHLFVLCALAGLGAGYCLHAWTTSAYWARIQAEIAEEDRQRPMTCHQEGPETVCRWRTGRTVRQ